MNAIMHRIINAFLSSYLQSGVCGCFLAKNMTFVRNAIFLWRCLAHMPILNIGLKYALENKHVFTFLDFGQMIVHAFLKRQFVPSFLQLLLNKTVTVE